MATNNPALTAPVASVFTELWYGSGEDTGLKQVFGVQSVPVISGAKEDVTYRTLESDEEFAVKGVRAFEAIEVETIYYKDQFDELLTLAAGSTEPWWYVKLPDASAGTGAGVKPTVIKWKGSLDVTLGEISQDDMIKCTLKIGKSTVPEMIDGLPVSGS